MKVLLLQKITYHNAAIALSLQDKDLCTLLHFIQLIRNESHINCRIFFDLINKTEAAFTFFLIYAYHVPRQ